MRLVVLGGTRFIGRAIAGELIAHGHRVMLVHRGTGGCQVFPSAIHVHVNRAELSSAAAVIRSFRAQALVDVNAMTADDVAAAEPVFAGCARIVVISSCDVYEAYHSHRKGVVSQSGQVVETSPLRTVRHAFPDSVPGCRAYEKLEVEEAWRRHAAIILRPTAAYGPHDYLAREAFIIDRVRAGRLRIPFGPGNLLYSRVSAAELATCVRLAVEGDESLVGEVFNVAESEVFSVEAWAHMIAEALGARIRLVRVPDAVLPPDLAITSAHRQHLVISSEKAVSALRWRPLSAARQVEESVRWHAEHRAVRGSFDSDDRALRHRLERTARV